MDMQVMATSWCSRRAEVCARAGWRCQICQLPEGTRVLGPTGRFYRIFLTVDEQRRQRRALCQRCKINETQETAVSLAVTPLPATVGKKSPMRRLHVELVPIMVERPALPASSATWML